MISRVDAVDIDDEVRDEVGRGFVVNLPAEADELLMTMARRAVANHYGRQAD